VRRFTSRARDERTWVLGLTFAMVAGVLLGAPATLTLKDALALAEKNDPALLAASSDATAAGEDRKQARAALYPALSGRSEYLGTEGDGKLPQGRFVTNDGVHVYREWAVVHQDFSPGVLSRVAVQRASISEAIARAKVEIARRGLAATVTKDYYTLIVAQRKYATAQQALDQAQHALKISQDLERGREVAHSDVVKSQLLENTQQQALEEAKLGMENARLDLAVLLFRDFDENFSVVDDMDVAPALPPLPDVETMAARQNPTLGAAMEAVRGAQLDVTLARQAYLPTLTVDAVYGIEANSIALNSATAANKELGPVPNLGYFVTASLNIPVWDWGVRRSKVRQSELKQKAAAVDLTATQRTLIRNLRGYYDEAQTARRQIDLLRRAVDLASEGLRLSTLRYQAGEATIIELTDAQTSFTQTRNAYDDGMVRYRLRRHFACRVETHLDLLAGGLGRHAPLSRGAADTSVRATLQPTFSDTVVLAACGRSLSSRQEQATTPTIQRGKPQNEQAGRTVPPRAQSLRSARRLWALVIQSGKPQPKIRSATGGSRADQGVRPTADTASASLRSKRRFRALVIQRRIDRLLVVIALLFLAACGSQPQEKEKAPAPVQVTAVSQATIRRIVQGDGALFPRDQASLMPKIVAPVQKFYVNRGDHVKQGQLLAMLENRDLIDAAEESKGAVDQAESNLRTTEGATVPDSVVKAQTDAESAREARDNAKAVLDSRQQLFKDGALAGRLVDESRLAYAQAETQYRAAQEHLKTLESVKQDQVKGASAQVASAKAHYASQEVQVAYSRIVSPISGIVADRPLNAGEMANPGSPVITIVDISRVVARIDIPQSDAPAVKIGQTAMLTRPDSKDEVEGRVSVVSPAADPNTTTVQIWIQVDNPGERLKPGMAVHAAIATEVYKAATVVPAAAILPGETGGTAVLTVSSDSVAHKRAVTLGVREGNQVQILSGANPGEEVVVAGGMGLDDKTKVKVITTAVEESDDEDENADEPGKDQKAAPKKDPAKP
jgi:outer membrane protein TolC/multidrug resistance efflux pump